MKEKSKWMPTFLVILYITFSLSCGAFGWAFYEWRIVLFRIWYQGTMLIWLSLDVAAIVLGIKLCKHNKRKSEKRKWKE